MVGVQVVVAAVYEEDIRTERVDDLFCQLYVPEVVVEVVEAMIPIQVPSLETLGPNPGRYPDRSRYWPEHAQQLQQEGLEYYESILPVPWSRPTFVGAEHPHQSPFPVTGNEHFLYLDSKTPYPSPVDLYDNL